MDKEGSTGKSATAPDPVNCHVTINHRLKLLDLGTIKDLDPNS